jgi:hypothetical protein
MPLPKIDMPLYEVKLPSNGKKIKYRPFTVKEEKILLTAQEAQDTAQMITSIMQIINNCLVDYDVEDLAVFDIEYVLINIRSKSVDNNVEFEIEDPETEERIKLTMDLSNVKVIKDERHTNKIKIDDNYTLILKYPSLEMISDMLDPEMVTPEKTFEVLTSCIDKLATEEEVFNFKDFTKKEVDEFIESLHSDVVKKMKEFFDTIPKIRHEIPYVNSEGKEKTFVVEGLQSFFI